MNRAYLAPDVLLKMLVKPDRMTQALFERMRMEGVEPVTSLFALYEACASITEEDIVTTDSIRMVMENVGFIHNDCERDLVKQGVSAERREHLRKVAKLEG